MTIIELKSLIQPSLNLETSLWESNDKNWQISNIKLTVFKSEGLDSP